MIHVLIPFSNCPPPFCLFPLFPLPHRVRCMLCFLVIQIEWVDHLLRGIRLQVVDRLFLRTSSHTYQWSIRCSHGYCNGWYCNDHVCSVPFILSVSVIYPLDLSIINLIDHTSLFSALPQCVVSYFIPLLVNIWQWRPQFSYGVKRVQYHSL